jgi:hypothetical protein
VSRREQVREAIARHRMRRRRGLFVRPVIVTKAQLDQLEERGYLNPGDRGTRADECEAIASFLTDSLTKASSGYFVCNSARRPLASKLARQSLIFETIGC